MLNLDHLVRARQLVFLSPVVGIVDVEHAHSCECAFFISSQNVAQPISPEPLDKIPFVVQGPVS